MEQARNRRNQHQANAAQSSPWRLSKEASQYFRFGAMVLTSTAVMFALTYTNSYAWDHVRWSEERFYMALLMGSAMGVIMLGFMWGMHKNTRVNIFIVAASLVIGLSALWLSRSQYFVNDDEYMNAMIPHHSIAILTSSRADIEDIRVRELADQIIASQEREIREMNWLIDDIERNGVASSDTEAERRRVPDFGGE